MSVVFYTINFVFFFYTLFRVACAFVICLLKNLFTYLFFLLAITVLLIYTGLVVLVPAFPLLDTTLDNIIIW